MRDFNTLFAQMPSLSIGSDVGITWFLGASPACFVSVPFRVTPSELPALMALIEAVRTVKTEAGPNV